ncbi:hypothetical protein AAY473_034757 [Plecturocebus cupreus]
MPGWMMSLPKARGPSKGRQSMEARPAPEGGDQGLRLLGFGVSLGSLQCPVNILLNSFTCECRLLDLVLVSVQFSGVRVVERTSASSRFLLLLPGGSIVPALSFPASFHLPLPLLLVLPLILERNAFSFEKFSIFPLGSPGSASVCIEWASPSMLCSGELGEFQKGYGELFEPRGVKNIYSTPISTDVGVIVKKITLLFCLKFVESPENWKCGREEVLCSPCGLCLHMASACFESPTSLTLPLPHLFGVQPQNTPSSLPAQGLCCFF